MEEKMRVNMPEKEKKELIRRKAQLSKPMIAGYFIILLIVLALCHVVDETATNINGSLQSNIVNEFYVNGMGLSYNEGLSRLSFLNIISLVILLITPVYKTLADKWGRKPLLVINTLGFAVGVGLCFLSYNPITYIIGAATVSFFVSHDMQVTYILEAAPANKRARFYGLTKGIGTLGVILLPVVRNIFMGNDPTRWRMVYIVPGMVAIVLAILMSVLMRETDTFLEQRIKYLETPKEQRGMKKEQKVGIGAGFRYIWQHKTLRWMIAANIIWLLSITAVSGFFQSIMHLSGMTTEEITISLYAYPFVFGGAVLLCGFLADKFGRKKTVAGCAAIFMVTFVLFVVGCKNSWPPILIGVLYAVYISAFWQAGDYRGIVSNELIPTRIRFSVGGAMGLVTIPAILIGQIISSAAVAYFDVGFFCLAVALPCAAISTLIFNWKIPETKGVDLNDVPELQ